MQKPKSEIVGYIVQVGVFGEEPPFDDMLAIYQSSGVCLSSGDDSICGPISEYWRHDRIKGLDFGDPARDFHDPPAFETLEEARRHRAERLEPADGISVHVHLPGDVELSRDVTVYGCLFEITREVG